MVWKFDPLKVDIVWINTIEDLLDSATIDFGQLEGDLAIDAGERMNDISVVDQGDRMI
jgi:hypothetical protein